MNTIRARFRSLYGASPWHLLAVLLSFVVLGYVVYVMGLSTLWDPKVWWQSILVWFLGAVLLHDLILFPIYALADRTQLAGAHALRKRRNQKPATRPRVSPVNYVRVPFLASGLLFLLFFPGIISQGAATYLRATGQTQEPIFGRWLLLTAGIFVVAALTYVVRLAVSHRKETAALATAGMEPNERMSQDPQP